MRHALPAFAAIEVLLVVAILALAFAATTPFVYRFRNQQLREVLRSDLVQLLRQAQTRALQSEQGDHWGVRILSGAFILYRGASYATRDVPFDTIYRVQEPAMWTGLSEVTFRRARGTPFTGGTLSFHGPIGSGTILVNAVGGIFFQE